MPKPYNRHPPDGPHPIRYVNRIVCRLFGHKPILPSSLPVCRRCQARLPKEQ